MNIVIVSAFRDSSDKYIFRYLNQVKELSHHAGDKHTVRVVAIEGDSRDDTRGRLLLAASSSHFRGLDLTVTTHHTGKKRFGSTEELERLEALTGVMLAGMSSVDPSRDDVVLYVESDLLWEPHQVGSCIDLAYRREEGFDVIAPLIFAGNLFYDIWAFRKNGERFSPFLPFHRDLLDEFPLMETSLSRVRPQLRHLKPLVEIDSAGSCLCFRSELARDVKVSGKMGLLSWCEAAREQGYRIGVATEFSVRHP